MSFSDVYEMFLEVLKVEVQLSSPCKSKKIQVHIYNAPMKF